MAAENRATALRNGRGLDNLLPVQKPRLRGQLYVEFYREIRNSVRLKTTELERFL